MIYDTDTLMAWMNQAKGHPGAVQLSDSELIYKGFKIEIHGDACHIFDVRHRDLYSPVSKANLRLMQEQGFIRACDVIMYRRSLRQIERIKKELSRIGTSQRRLKSKQTRGATRKYNGLENQKRELILDYHMYVHRTTNFN